MAISACFQDMGYQQTGPRLTLLVAIESTIAASSSKSPTISVSSPDTDKFGLGAKWTGMDRLLLTSPELSVKRLTSEILLCPSAIGPSTVSWSDSSRLS